MRIRTDIADFENEVMAQSPEAGKGKEREFFSLNTPGKNTAPFIPWF
jgi:hypothetical protein